MLRLWGIWLIASIIFGVMMGLKQRVRTALLCGAMAGAGALGFNLIEGDGAVSSFWSMIAAGGGFIAGGLIGAAVVSAFARDRP